MSDPINPPHYAGRACADIGERLTANGYQILKYVWRLGRKDAMDTELGKAAWYAKSERNMFACVAAVGITMRTAPLAFDLEDAGTFLEKRIADQPEFTQNIARRLWRGYNLEELEGIVLLLESKRDNYASS